MKRVPKYPNLNFWITPAATLRNASHQIKNDAHESAGDEEASVVIDKPV